MRLKLAIAIAAICILLGGKDVWGSDEIETLRSNGYFLFYGKVEKMCGAQMRLKLSGRITQHKILLCGKDVWGSDEIETWSTKPRTGGE